MNYDLQLRLQSYVDGELSAKERAAVDQNLAHNPEAKALVEELRATKHSLVDFEETIKVPDTREFYWSQIQRRIEAAQKQAPARETEASWIVAWRRWLMPIGTAAALVLVGLFAGMQMGLFGPTAVALGETESAVTDPGALTYQDFSTGTTLVWVTFPGEN